MILNSSNETWVFGLSIDEKIEWCLCRAYQNEGKWILSENRAHKILGSISGDPAELYRDGELFNKLKETLTLFLKSKKVNGRGDFVSAIGVSIVGIADRLNLTLQNVARTDWDKPPSKPIVDFRALFSGMFNKIDVEAKFHGINIHNETTAKCLAEWSIQSDNNKVDSLFYVMFSRGVNAAFVADGHPPYTELHTELGHMWPRPHSDDINDFKTEYSGCRIHKVCFEGLASSRRIDNQWGGGKRIALSTLPLEAQVTISFYIAQMCINGVLAVSPARILLGGETVFPALLEQVRHSFHRFNSCSPDDGLDIPGEPYVDYPAMHEPNFIDMATISYQEAGIAASLELAIRVLRHPAEVLYVGKRRTSLSAIPISRPR
jgi:predicted NBD/HSP70 family sugar kinase